ncbi:MAG: FAD-dependent oxidoreductase, partial [Sphaerochaeta sp.]|nr:FAD-dependent oxidoreductase [Sphaerochaeta sp.]
METITLTRTVPKGAFYDVIVCGSGPSGITAALSAARAGKRTALIERYGVVGGNLTIGHVGPILGVVGPGTMRDEIMPLLGVPDNDELGVVGVAHDFERAKSVLTHLLDAENIDTYLQSPVVDVVMDGDEIAALIIGSKEGLLGLSAKIYIDATGDGDVAALAGGIVEYGRPGDGLAQPVTLEFLIDGVDESKAITCIGEVDDVSYKGEPFIEYTKRHAQAGNLPEHLFSVRLHRTTVSGQRNVNTTQMNKINALKPGEMMIAEAELRRQIYQVTDFLNKHVEG